MDHLLCSCVLYRWWRCSALPVRSLIRTRITGRLSFGTPPFIGGFVMVLLLHNIPCRFLLCVYYMLLPVLMLMLIVTPFIGVDANDAHRWLEIMGIQLQPSEFGKLACVVFVAFLLSKRKSTENQIFKHILIGVGTHLCLDSARELSLRRLCYSGFVS